jgi:hypothetical protein
MKAVSIKVLRDELKSRTPVEVLQICMQLVRFKKENKELLTYLLFDSEDEASYVSEVQSMIDERFSSLNDRTNYSLRKGIRSILNNTKKFIRYSSDKETEVALLLYFCKAMSAEVPYMEANRRILAIYLKQMEIAERKMQLLHEDLQYDYNLILNELRGRSDY